MVQDSGGTNKCPKMNATEAIKFNTSMMKRRLGMTLFHITYNISVFGKT